MTTSRVNSEMIQPVADDWNRFWSDDQAGRFTSVSWSKRRIMDVLKPYVVAGKKVLDAGCGSGFFSKYFCDGGMKTVSLDYSKAALQIASRMTEGRSTVVQKDLLAGDLSRDFSEGFDLIFSDGLLEHFSAHQQDRILANFSQVLTPHGVLVTFVPNRFSPWELIRPVFMPGIEEKPFVISELIRLHQRNGLMIVSQGGINTLPFKLSPDSLTGSIFGMLLYVIVKKNAL